MLTAVMFILLSQSDSISPLLDRGQLVLVEQSKDGKFAWATGIVMIQAPPEKVWATLLKMEDFKQFMPKVTTSEVTFRERNDMHVHFVLDVPGPDTDYTIRYTRDDAKRTLTGVWAGGDLKDSKWFWTVEPAPGGKTLLSQRVSVKNFSSILTSVEDDQQTMTVGVNVSSALAAGKALKKQCERPAARDAGAP